MQASGNGGNRSRNIHHMPQIGSSNAQAQHFKSAQNAYQGVGSNSLNNLHMVGGNMLGPKFTSNYVS